MNLGVTYRKILVLLLMFGGQGWVPTALAVPLSISETPLFLTANVPPNIVVTLDDSGSMSRAFTPDVCGNPNAICDNNPDSNLDPRYLKSSHYNPIYYNPTVTYTAPVDAAGASLATTFANAWVNGYAHTLPDISPDSFNLASQYRPTAGLFLHSSTKSHEFMRHYSSDVRCQSSQCQYNSKVGAGTAAWVNMGGSSCSSNSACQTRQMPAYYYVFDESNTNCTGTAAQKKVDNDCYDIKIVGASEQQNFANWYSFYRTRNLATIASTSLAFAGVQETTRVSWQALNTCRGSSSSLVDTTCDGWSGSLGFSNAIKPFTGTHKQNFYSWLFRLNTNTSTPLREAMKRAGDYYSTSGENSPYDDDLNTAGSVSGTTGQLSCRKNFHILMTDGIWNDSTPSGITNVDSGLTAPYKGTADAGLSDVAYKYWSTDLVDLPGNDNNLIPYVVETGANLTETNHNAKNDPATWQHMVNFTVGLGLTPFLQAAGLTYDGSTYTGSYPGIAAGTTPWPGVGTDGGKVADLWHAAINSRGQFFSADTPQSLLGSFSAVANAIEDSTPSAAALAANSTSIQTGALVYQATFNPNGWSGDLVAYPIGFGGVVGAAEWRASEKLPSVASRNIITFNGSNGVAFSWGSLSAAQQSLLNTNAGGTVDTLGSARLDWLRGVQTQEVVVVNGAVTSGIFRARDSVLGDIINSDPAFAYEDDFGYAAMSGGGASEAASYDAYVASKAGRTPAVFVGGNDGMLHAFRADAGDTESGRELFAYVPGGVYAKLSALTDPGYAHQYYVDAGPAVGDAYLGDCTTELVGAHGGGGNTIYALDVSNVATPSASMVMWEYTEADMGLTYSKPQIARLNNGQWAAIFGNGYNSVNERAYLYVVNLETGALIAKIEAGTGTANGLSTPVLRDVDGDMIMDYAYAGDLQGNLWKFDLSSFANQATPQFVARNGSGQVQPITAQPTIGGHPSGGVLVYFGTGQYLTTGDPLNTQMQSFYAIWDNGSPVTTTDRSELQVQSIMNQTVETFTLDDKGTATTSDDDVQTSALRETSANALDWGIKRGWYMDFDEPSSAGERVVSQALLRYDRVIFLTVIPSANVCEAGGESWLMELDAITGAKTGGSSFDFNDDDVFDGGDFLASGSVASGVKTTVGITKPPAWFTSDLSANNAGGAGGVGKDFKVMTGSTGGIQSLGNNPDCPTCPGGGGGGGPSTLRRTYWMQIQ